MVIGVGLRDCHHRIFVVKSLVAHMPVIFESKTSVSEDKGLGVVPLAESILIEYEITHY
jgi:hypothetical protein